MYNHRYLQYCRVHGCTPEQMLIEDAENWPGGSMTGYILWNSARLEEYKKINPDAFYRNTYNKPDSLLDHESYDNWLQTLTPTPYIEK